MHTPEVTGNVSISPDAQIGPNVRLLAGRVGTIVVGRRCHLKAGVVIACYGGTVVLGARVSLGEYTVVYGHGDVRIDDCVAVGPHCTISSQEHTVESRVALRFSGERLGATSLGVGAIVSAHCVVTAGVSIGQNTLVGAGSVVTESLPPHVVAFGVPCKIRVEQQESPLYGYMETNDRVPL